MDEQGARSFYNSGGGNYPPVPPAPSASQTLDPFAALRPAAGAGDSRAAGVAPAGGDGAAAPQTPPSALENAAGDAPDPAMAALERAEMMYGAQTHGVVDWSEQSAQPGDFRFTTPSGLLDTSEAGKEVMGRFRDGLAEAGAGQTLATELWGYAVRAVQGGSYVQTSQVAAEKQLRDEWGGRYEKKIADAQGLIKKAATRCPEITAFLMTQGLGNDPAFIKLLAYTAARRRRA